MTHPIASAGHRAGARRCAASLVLLWAFARLATAQSPDHTARLLAGLDTEPPASVQVSAAAIRAHARRTSEAWRQYEQAIGTPMREWAVRELPDTSGATVFYPFSGPDFPTVQQLFPRAQRYLLVAIQPAGPPPALEGQPAAAARASLDAFQAQWQSFAGMGFFRTLDLDEDLRAARRVGFTALLMAFAVRSGHQVMDVVPLRVNADGSDLEPHPGDRASPATWQSVRIAMRREGREVHLDYLRLDLSDASLARKPAARAWIERAAAHPTVLKAASHLPQHHGFGVVRDAILNGAPLVWQDETGLDHAALDRGFSVALYGRFSRPNRIFSQGSQRSLALAYAKTAARPLGFRVGYDKDSGYAVQVATRRPGTQAAAANRPGAAAPEPLPGQPPRASAGSPEGETQALRSRIDQQLAALTRQPSRVFYGAGGAEAKPEQATYLARVRNEVELAIRRAAPTARRGMMLSVAVRADGTVDGVDMEPGSGNVTLHRAIRDAVAEQRLPAPPAHLRAGADLVVVSLRFSPRAAGR